MIYIEGKLDYHMILALGFGKKEIKIAGNKGAVCNKLQMNENCKGMIDEDPGTGQPPYLKSLAEKEQQHQMKLLYDEKRNNYVIVICPYLEPWIIGVAKKLKISLNEQYNLPETPEELKKIIYSPSKLKNFKQFIQETKGKSKALQTLEKWLG